MALPTLIMIRDGNGNPMPLLPFSGAPITVDGTADHAESAALEGQIVRIFALTVGADDTLRFLVGSAPEAADTSHPLAAGESIYYPINNGDKVSVKGGKGVISILGK